MQDQRQTQHGDPHARPGRLAADPELAFPSENLQVLSLNPSTGWRVPPCPPATPASEGWVTQEQGLGGLDARQWGGRLLPRLRSQACTCHPALTPHPCSSPQAGGAPSWTGLKAESPRGRAGSLLRRVSDQSTRRGEAPAEEAGPPLTGSEHPLKAEPHREESMGTKRRPCRGAEGCFQSPPLGRLARPGFHSSPASHSAAPQRLSQTHPRSHEDGGGARMCVGPAPSSRLPWALVTLRGLAQQLSHSTGRHDRACPWERCLQVAGRQGEGRPRPPALREHCTHWARDRCP